MSTIAADRPVVVVDDQLALLAALGLLPTASVTTIVTTYAWQQRILGAFVAPRSSEGQLQRIAASVSASAATVLAAVGDPIPSTSSSPTASDRRRVRPTPSRWDQRFGG